MDIRTYLENNILLFDGAMGTLCNELIPESIGIPCETLNHTHPDKIWEIYRAYIDAGCKAIKTNTFGVNRISMSQSECRKHINAGFELASSFSEEAWVFADIGPITVTDAEDVCEEYQFVADTFLNCGAKCFLFETNSVLNGLLETAEYIKSRCPSAFIILSFASLPDGFTRTGQSALDLLRAAEGSPAVDAIGLNCSLGPLHMAKLVSELPKFTKPLSVMPNAGYPVVLNNRIFFDGDPQYFSRQIGSIAAHGAGIVGGCCGTNSRHISACAQAINNLNPADIARSDSRPEKKHAKNHFWDELCDPDKRPFAVEFDPPETADVEKFMAGAKALRDGGASVVTIADCPIARARMDSSLLACKLHRELGITPLPHMTCRDRNLNAIKALLLGLCAEGVHNVLTITGDPIPTAERDEVKSVYNFNSRMLAKYINTLGETLLPTPFHVFGALNVNAHNFDVQLRIAQAKEANGICGFLTQPVLTPQAFENLKHARQTLKGKILGGIFPLVSHRNACFMNSEVAGVKVDERVIALYEDKDRDEGEALALAISAEIASRIRPYVDGYYLMTPFSRTELMCRIMAEISSQS